MRRSKRLVPFIQFVLCYVLAFVACATNINGAVQADTSLRFKHYDNNDGLSQNSVYDIVEDKFGFLWVATQDGLNRFDGYQFKQFKHDANLPYSISNSFTLCLFVDDDGELWVGTYNGGLNHFDYETERFTSFQHDEQNPLSISNNHVTSIVQLNSQKLLIGTKGGGLNVFDKSTQQFERLNTSKALDRVNTLEINQSNNQSKFIWVGTENNGLFKLSPDGQVVTSWGHKADDPQSLSNNNVLSLLFDSNSRLWVGTHRGLNQLSIGQGGFHRFLGKQTEQEDGTTAGSISENVVRTLIEDKENQLWIGTNNGIQLLDNHRESVTTIAHEPTDKDSLNGQVVSTLYLSKNGILWVGMFTTGMDKLELATKQFHHYKHNSNNPYSLSKGSVWNFADAKNGNFWVATDGGINYYDSQQKRFTGYRKDSHDAIALSSNLVWAIVEDAPGIVWAGTFDGGLNYVDTVNQKTTVYLHDSNDPNSLSHNHVASLYIDSKRNLWVGTFAGLDLFDSETNQFVHYLHDPENPNSIAPHWISNIIEDQHHHIWTSHVGGGVSRFDPVSRQFSHFRHDPANENSIASNIVASMLEDHKGNIWVATYGGGISVIHNDLTTIDRYTVEDGLISNATLAILESAPDVFWISTNNGLSRFDLKSKTFVNYKVDDGLQDNEFNSNAAFKSDNGELFFGGINGFNRFYPTKVYRQPRNLTVKLTQVHVSNVPVAIANDNSYSDTYLFTLPKAPFLLEELEITHNENLISFEFSALDYEKPDAIEYQYKLQNFDEQWITTDHNLRRATYTNIPAGNYQLQIRAKLPRGQWQNNGVFLNLTVLPPPWLSWWAYTFYALIVLIIVGTFVLQRIQKFVALKKSKERLQVAQAQLRQLNDELEHRVVERTAELRDALEELTSTQQQLIESEKMSSLAGLLVGIAHELNTPMGVAVTSSTLIQEAFDGLSEKCAQGKLRVTDIEQFQLSTQKGLDLLNSSLNKTVNLIHTFKALSPDASNEPTKSFNLFDTLDLLARNHYERKEGVGVAIEIDCPKSLALNTYVNDFIEIIQQLIENACHHAFDNIEQPTIRIEVTSEEKHVTILISDNGVGLSTEKLKKILDPFYTSQRGTNRAGLGLSIIYNKIHYRLGGDVIFASEVGQGLTVRIKLPVDITDAGK